MKQYKTPKAVLRAAARLVREGWAQHHMAYDAAGNPVGAHSSDAVRWCVLGAMSVCADNLPVYCESIAALCKAPGINQVVAWNDQYGQTAEHVAAALERAAGTL